MKATSSIITKGLRKRNKLSSRQRIQKLWSTLSEAIKEAAKHPHEWITVENNNPVDADKVTAPPVSLKPTPPPERPQVQYTTRGLTIPHLDIVVMVLLTGFVAILLLKFAPEYIWWILLLIAFEVLYKMVKIDIIERHAPGAKWF